MTTPASRTRTALVLRRLAACAPLSEEDVRVLGGLDGSVRQHVARTELCAQGEILHPRAFVAGWASRETVLADGRRQIISFIVPGDLIGVAPGQPRPATHSIVALTAGATVDAEVLRKAVGRAVDDGAGIGDALRALATVEEAMARDQIVRLGRQTAYERVAHLFLELHGRAATVGLADGRRFNFPLTQEMMADALGLSVVHVNRTVQQMRREGVIEWRAGAVTLLRRDELITVAGWSPLPGVRAAPVPDDWRVLPPGMA